MNQNPIRARRDSPEAATNEPASPSTRPGDAAAPADPPAAAAEAGPVEIDRHGYAVYATEAENGAYWQGISAGLKLGKVPEPSHMPDDFDAELARDGRSPSLVSAKLSRLYAPVVVDARGRAIRTDGFTPARQRTYLDALAGCGVVADSCRAAGISRDTAYGLRNRAEGRHFDLAWQAAILLSRGRMGDELSSRAMNGVIDRVYRNGELVAERHRHDNRLALAVLTRLDRQAEGLGEGAQVARAIAQEWDSYLAIVEAGGEGADRFLADRAPKAEAPAARKELESTASMLARLTTFKLHADGRAGEIPTADLDPAAMAEWTDEQWLRADLSGFLDRLPEEEWPDEAFEPEPDMDGMCRSRQVYLSRHPEAANAEATDEGDEMGAWKDEDEGCLVTDYPPPAGYDGFEWGEWGDDDYRRELTPAEEARIEADSAALDAEKAEERALALAAARAARDAYFGFAGDESAGAGPEPAGQGAEDALRDDSADGGPAAAADPAAPAIEDAAGCDNNGASAFRRGESG